jgi:hypothetical protein
MTLLYILYGYGDGPTNMTATLDKSKVISLINSYNDDGWFEKVDEPDLIERASLWLETNGDIIGEFNLMRGWGGLTLQIVELDKECQL